MWSLLRQARLLQVIVVVVVAANLASGGTFDVALPALAHARFGPGGYGALIACLGAGAVTGTLAAALSTKADRPAVLACACYLIEAVAIAFVPFLGGLAGAAVATLFFPVADAVVAAAILGALSQSEFRDLGTAEPPEAKMTIEPA